MRNYCLLLCMLFFVLQSNVYSQQLLVAGRPSQLNIRKAGENSVRITLKPISYLKDFPSLLLSCNGNTIRPLFRLIKKARLKKMLAFLMSRSVKNR